MICDWKSVSGKGVIRGFTRPLPLPAPWGLPAPYPILPLPEWGLKILIDVEKKSAKLAADYVVRYWSFRYY